MFDTIPGKDKNDFTIMIDGKEIIHDNAVLIKTMDTGCDAFTAEVPWMPGQDLKLDELLKPYSYVTCGIYLGGTLVSEQILYNVTNKVSDKRLKVIEGFSKIADIIDSTVFPPYEANNITLTERCRQQCKPFGINVIVGDDAAALINPVRRILVTVGYKRVPRKVSLEEMTSEQKKLSKQFGPLIKNIDVPIRVSKLINDELKFPRVVAEPTEKIFEHLVKLAAQRGILLSCTRNGDLLLTRANLKSKPVGTIEENLSYDASTYEAKFNGRERFANYRAIVKFKGGQQVKTASDKTVVAPRLLTFNANDDIPGNATNAAKWRKNKTAADAMTFTFPVNSWYAPDGKLYQPNTQIVIISETMETKKGFTFLINQVEYKKDTTAVLSLKPPSMYSTGDIIEPWIGKQSAKQAGKI